MRVMRVMRINGLSMRFSGLIKRVQSVYKACGLFKNAILSKPRGSVPLINFLRSVTNKPDNERIRVLINHYHIASILLLTFLSALIPKA